MKQYELLDALMNTLELLRQEEINNHGDNRIITFYKDDIVKMFNKLTNINIEPSRVLTSMKKLHNDNFIEITQEALAFPIIFQSDFFTAKDKDFKWYTWLHFEEELRKDYLVLELDKLQIELEKLEKTPLISKDLLHNIAAATTIITGIKPILDTL